MIYGNMSMMIFILATGYLFAVYLLLALAKRNGRNSVVRGGALMIKKQHKKERGLTTNVTEVVNSQ